MSLLITIVAVGLGVAYAGLVDRRFGARSWTSSLLMVPVVVAFAVVVLTADLTDPLPRAVQAFGMGALVQTGIGGWRADRERRRRINAAEAAERAAEEDQVRRRNAEATGPL